MIPKSPVAGDATQIDDDVVGIMTNGVLLDSHAQTWAYDTCNGHSDKKHQYHYHIPPICYLKSMGVPTPESDKWWINDAGTEVRPYDEMAEQFPKTGISPIVGWARDGFPIYALYGPDNSLVRSKVYGGNLDECNGMMGEDGAYAYYITAEPPFVPTCLKGKVGNFAFATSDKKCPAVGIENTISGVKAAPAPPPAPDTPPAPTGGEPVPPAPPAPTPEGAEEPSAAFANVPTLCALALVATLYFVI